MTILRKTGLHKLISSPGVIVTVGILTASPFFAHGQHHPQHSQGTEQSQKGSHSDTSFIKEAAEANLAEIQLGKLAEQKGQNDQIKKLAQVLVRHHTEANEKLQQLAQTKGVQWPGKPPQRAEKDLKHLEKLSGSQFDQMFAEHAIQDHTRDIKKYEKAEGKIQDPTLKDYVQTTLPKLQEHLKLSVQTAQAVGVPQQRISALQKSLEEGMGAPGLDSGTQHGGGRKGGWPYGGNR